MNDLHFGVCVGIDRYPGLPGRDLESARRDAEAFRDWLLDPDGGGLPPDNVRLVAVAPEEPFPSVGDARPQQREVNRALHGFNQRLQEHVAINPQDWPRTRVYLYAAGHGIGPPNAEGALLMADAERELLGNNIELSLYADWYLRCGLVHEVVIFADCCREIAGGIPPANAPPFNICQFPAFKGTVRFTGYASRFGDVAWEPLDSGDLDSARGYFTKALLDGLRGPGDPETGEVNAASLAQYVQQAVDASTAGIAPYPQRGELRGDLATPIVFRAAGAGHQPVPGRKVTIRFPTGFGGEVSLRSGIGQEQERARWRASDGPWQLPLADGLYQVIALNPAGGPFAASGLFALAGGDLDVQL